jgi:excisionase family DNA binding protein
MTSHTPPLLYSRKAAAAMLSLSVRAIDLLVSSRRITAVQIGRRRLIHTAELSRFASIGSQEHIRQTAHSE